MEVLRSYQIIKDQRKTFTRKDHLRLVRKMKKKCLKENKIIKKIFGKKISKDIRTGEYLKYSFFISNHSIMTRTNFSKNFRKLSICKTETKIFLYDLFNDKLSRFNALNNKKII